MRSPPHPGTVCLPLSSPIRILVVDDDPHIREVIRVWLALKTTQQEEYSEDRQLRLEWQIVDHLLSHQWEHLIQQNILGEVTTESFRAVHVRVITL